MKSISALLMVSLVFLISCAHAGQNEKEMYTLASALLHISSSVESAVRYENAPDSLEDRELVKYATRNDPALIQPLDGYYIKAKGVMVGQKKHSIILICTSDKQQALLEDIGCTTALDKNSWKAMAPCEFTLDMSTECMDKCPDLPSLN